MFVLLQDIRGKERYINVNHIIQVRNYKDDKYAIELSSMYSQVNVDEQLGRIGADIVVINKDELDVLISFLVSNDLYFGR